MSHNTQEENLKEQGIDLEKNTFNLDQMTGFEGFHELMHEIEYDLHAGRSIKKLKDFISNLLTQQLNSLIVELEEMKQGLPKYPQHANEEYSELVRHRNGIISDAQNIIRGKMEKK